MNEFVNTIIQMNIYASIAILSVIIFRSFFKNIPKKYICLLWLIVAVRLVCPVSYESKYSVFNLKPVSNITNSIIEDKDKVGTELALTDKNTGSNLSTETLTSTDGDTNIKNAYTEGKTVSGLAGEKISENNNGTQIGENARGLSNISAGNLMLNLKSVGLYVLNHFAIIWLSGVVLLTTILLVTYVRLISKIKKSNIVKRDGFYESDRLSTPCVVGFINPSVYLPIGISDDEKDYILLHEKIHIKNKDNIIRHLSLILLCVNWFNPLVHIAYRLLNSDLEMRCDEEVVESMNKEIKGDYCKSIVMHALESRENYKAVRVSFAQKSFGGMEVKMRINNIFTKKVSKQIAALAIIGAVGVTTVISAQAKNVDKKTDTKKETVVTKEDAATNDVVSEEYVNVNMTDAVIKGLKDEVLKSYAKDYANQGYYIDDYVAPFFEEGEGFSCFDSLGGDNNEAICIYKAKEDIDSVDDFLKYENKESQNLASNVYGGDNVGLTTSVADTEDEYIVETYDNNNILINVTRYIKADKVIINKNCNLNNPNMLG